MGEEDHALIDRYISRQIKPKVEHDYLSLAHTFSLLKRNPQEAFENLFVLMFMAPLLVGRSDTARRNLSLLKGLVDKLESQERQSDLAKRIIDGFYEEFELVLRKINKIQQLYHLDIDLSFLKDLDETK